MNCEEAKEYAKEVILSDLEEAGDQDVIKKILILLAFVVVQKLTI